LPRTRQKGNHQPLPSSSKAELHSQQHSPQPSPTLERNPAYYTRGSIEVWDFIRDQDLNYHLGCAVKYICRAGFKDDAIRDLNKAIHYLQNERDHLLDAAGRDVSIGYGTAD
jgi:hypothetical protein